MTIAQLKEAIKDFPDNMDVFVCERKTDFSYGLVNSVYTKEINFSEEPGGEIEARDIVVVIDEE